MMTTVDLDVHRSRARARIATVVRDRLRLPPTLTMSEHADKHRYLSGESSAEPGPWRTDRVPYLREPMDTISSGEYQEIFLGKCSQSAGTELINNTVCYYVDQEPSPILVIQPNVKPMAESYSKDRLAPMLRDSPRLRGKVRDPRSRDSGNTVLHKTFPGGYITVIGANSPAGLASRPIRIVLADELDRWGASAGTEGDPLGLAEARTTTFRHRKKIVTVTTFGNEGESRGEKLWKLTDQRHYYVPCPHCSHMQPLEWRDTQGQPDIRAGKGDVRLVWEKEELPDGTHLHRTETAAYQCRSCSQLIYDTAKPDMLAKGQWVKHNPTAKKAGFHIAGLLSPWVRWTEIAAGWVQKHHDPEQRKTFVNTVLGLLYQESGEVPDAAALSSRREIYSQDPAVDLPNGTKVLTMAIDLHADRLEIEVRGWGVDEETWGLRLERPVGDVHDLQDLVWQTAEGLLSRTWKRADGEELRIMATMVDTGYLTDVAYRWVRPRQSRRVFAYKGADNAKTPISRASKANADGVKVVTVHPTSLKDILFRRLKKAAAGPGYLHIGPVSTGHDEAYLKQFGAEKRQVTFVKNQPKVEYIKIEARNEAIDLYVMNLAALRMLPRSLREFRAETSPPETAEAVLVTTTDEPSTVPDTPETPPVVVDTPEPAPRNGWLDWKNR